MKNRSQRFWSTARCAAVGLGLLLSSVAPVRADDPPRPVGPAAPPPPKADVKVTPGKGGQTTQGTFDDVSFDTPDAKRWKPEVRDNNLVFTATDATAPDFAQITVFASQDFTGDSEAFQKAFTQAMSHDLYQRGVTKLVSAPPLEPTVTGGVEIVRRLVTAEGKPTNQHNLYVGIHAGNRMEMVAYQTNSEETYARFGEDAQKFFQNINVKTGGATANDKPADPPAKTADAKGTGQGFGAMLRTVRPDAVTVIDGVGPASVPAAVRGERQIDGLFRYAKTGTILSSDMRRIIPLLDEKYFYFFPDGHVYFAIPPGGILKEHPTAADFTYFLKGNPADCGTYVVAGGKIKFQHAGAEGASEEYKFELGNPADGTAFNFEGAVVTKLYPFGRGERLAGTYVNDKVAGESTTTSFIVSTLTFNGDGTLSSDHWTGFNSRSELRAKYNTDGQVGTKSAGTYQFDGYVLTMNVAGESGKTTVCRPERDAKGRAPEVIYIDGWKYLLQR